MPAALIVLVGLCFGAVVFLAILGWRAPLFPDDYDIEPRDDDYEVPFRTRMREDGTMSDYPEEPHV